MTERRDDELVRGYLDGNGSDFEMLYLRHRSRLFGFVRSLGAAGAEAEDLFQETWLRAIRGLPKYRPEGKFHVWLFRIARNLGADRGRKASRRPGAFDGLDEASARLSDPYPHPDQTVMKDENSRLLQTALAGLVVALIGLGLLFCAGKPKPPLSTNASTESKPESKTPKPRPDPASSHSLKRQEATKETIPIISETRRRRP